MIIYDQNTIINYVSQMSLNPRGWERTSACRLGRNLRSRNSLQLEISMIVDTFQDQASRLFKKLPATVRNCSSHKQFYKDIKSILQNCAPLRFKIEKRATVHFTQD